MASGEGARQLIEPRDGDQIRRVVQVALDVFGRSLIGVYLHGSAVMGGLRPTSDVDVLAVIDRHSTREERRQLIKGLMPISGPPDPSSDYRPVELTVVTLSEVKPWRFPPRMEFQYGEWLKRDYEAGFVPEPVANPDLAPLIAVVLMGNHPLLGLPPAELLDPVPPSDLRAAVLEGIPGLMADLESDTRNVLLTLARIWHTTATDEITSKDLAGSWAAERLHGRDREILLLARDQYLAGTHGDWAKAVGQTRLAGDRIAEEIAAIRR